MTLTGDHTLLLARASLIRFGMLENLSLILFFYTRKDYIPFIVT